MGALTYVRLLGAFALQVEGGEPVTLPTKAQALVAYLALQAGRPIKRELISELLWPDRGERQARNSLKQELYVLRRDGFRGQDPIATRDEALALPPDRIGCDVHELRALLQPGSAASWQTIMALYPGPLLHGFAPVSPEFDDFLLGMRRLLEADVLGALGRLADDAATAGDTEQPVAIAERMLAIDPLREDIHRRLIRAYAQAGRRADAMRVYADAKALLRREMDVSPAGETEALVARIQDETAAAPASPPARMTVPAVPGLGGPPRIAVLPLRQSEDQPVASHLSDGITADIITQLAGLRELTVISHGSTFGLRDPYMQPHDIGRRLDARYLVIGRIRRGGDRLRLTTELTEAETGQIIFSHTDTVDAALSFDDQDRIVAQLVNRLVPQVRETELRRIRGKRPDVLSVYEKILLIREQIMLLNRDGFGQAKMLLDEVIQEDPGYGEAYALAADWHGLMVGEGWSANRAGDVAAIERLSKIALTLDNSNLRALVSYAYRRSFNYRDHVGAMQMFDQALDVAPSAANAWALSGMCVAFAGDATEAIRRASRALELSPYDREAYKFYHALCVAHYTADDYERAAEWGKRALGEKTVWRGTRGFTAASLAALGRLREAREIVAQIRAVAPTRRIGAVIDELAYQDVGRRRRYGEHLISAGFPE
jgi:DNA-binding SARP family transcriptional activator/Tfp pilus assembly protein PilF